jgi:hypothetical protein
MALFVLISLPNLRFPPEGSSCDGARPCLIDFGKAMNISAKPYKKNSRLEAICEVGSDL